jgi:hypothetical protein
MAGNLGNLGNATARTRSTQIPGAPQFHSNSGNRTADIMSDHRRERSRMPCFGFAARPRTLAVQNARFPDSQIVLGSQALILNCARPDIFVSVWRVVKIA